MTEQQPSNIWSLRVEAPGKLVLWGEYAVLVGAPAGVLAVDRYASCSIAPTTHEQWQLTTHGFTSEPTNMKIDWFASEQPPSSAHPGSLVWHAARANQWLPPGGAHIHLDSSAFYQGSTTLSSQEPVKLGLGSSAAICTALTYLVDQLKGSNEHSTNKQPLLTKALTAHRAAQQGAGSGIDVAASTLGGLLRYKLNHTEASESATLESQNQPETQPMTWPEALHWQAFWTGSPASTTDHLTRFDAWRAQGNTSSLTDLVAASEGCSDRLDLATLADYVRTLRGFDAASKIGIYTQGHEYLHKLAADIGVTYKPCGAGGGDLGIAFAADPAQLQRFASAAAANNFVQIRLEMAKHGVRTTLGNHQPNS